MSTENDDKELENDELDGGSQETQEREPEGPELPADPNEGINIETDEAKVSRRRQARAERQSKFKQLEEDNQRMRREMEEFRSRQQYQPPAQPQQQQQEHPAVARIREIDATTLRLQQEYSILAQGGKLTPEKDREYQQQALNLQTARMAAVAQGVQQPVDRQALVREAMWTQFTTKHADVFHDKNPNVAKWAWAEYHRRIAEGHADTEDMVEDILDQTRVKFGKTPRKLRGSKPSDSDRARFTGMASRGGSGGSTGEDGVVHMGPHEKRMARIAFGDKKGKDGKPLTEAQQYQHWANTVGKKLAASKKTG